MNKVLLIFLSVAIILSAVSCADGESAVGGTSESTDTAVIDAGTDDIDKNDNDRITDNEGENITEELDSDEYDESVRESDDSAVTRAPDEIPDVNYEDYINMTPQQQTDFIKSFSSVGKFTEWYNDAKSKYDKDNDKIYIGDESIDLGDIFNK